MCRITLLFLPLLLRLMTSRVLLKANFLFVVIKVGKLENRPKLTMNFLANFCGWETVVKTPGLSGPCMME
jgi:hypothetical protein